MRNRRLHRLLAVLLLLPFIAWASTGIFFLVRPAYEAAYEPLLIKSYALQDAAVLPENIVVLESRNIRSILGEHILVRSQGQWQHFNRETGQNFALPSEERVRILVDDAMSQNRPRYGEIISVQGMSINTSTGVEIILNWDTLSLAQMGRDTRWINKVYDIHYLRWTGIAWLDQLLGLLGLGLLILMTATGARMLFSRSHR